jgi:glucan phosphoethanolaminetransferase (alkaline phosphatase superfamily)
VTINKVTGWITVAASLSLLVLPVIFPVCTVEKSPMRCFYTYQAEFLFALLAVVIALSLFFTKETETKKLTYFFLFLIGIIVLVLPSSWAIGICGHSDSQCHITAAWTNGAAILLALAGLVGIWAAWRHRPNRKNGSEINSKAI